MKRAIFAIIFLCLMAGYSEAGDKFALGCFEYDDIQEVESRINHGIGFDEYMEDGRCLLIRYDSRSVVQFHEQFRLVEYQIGDGAVTMWTAWMNKE